MKYSLTNSKFQRAFGRYFCRKNYFSTNHTWEFEECQIILKKSKKEAPTVIVSACKILYSFFSGKIIPVFICSIVQTCKLFYCKIFQWIFFIYHNSYSIFSNDFCCYNVNRPDKACQPVMLFLDSHLSYNGREIGLTRLLMD